MIRQRLSLKLPRGFVITGAAWYEYLRSRFERALYVRLQASIIFAAGVVVVLYLNNLVTGGGTGPMNFLFPLLCLSAMYLHLHVTRDIVFMGRAVLFAALTGFVACSFMPASIDVNLIIFITFPVLALQTRGTRHGTWWIAIFIACCVSIIAVQHLLNPDYAPVYSMSQVFMASIAFAMNMVLTYTGERQHEDHLESSIHYMVFDDITRLPRRDVMMNSICGPSPLLLAILKINNFNDLGAVFGYELSDSVLQFVARSLKTGEEPLGYRAYRLRGTEFGILVETGESLGAHDTESIENMLRDIVDYLNRYHLPYEGSQIRLSYRIGGTLVDASNRDTALSQADMALKEAERLHRASAFFHSRTNLRDAAFQAIMKYSTLMENREKRSYRAVFQPVFDIETGAVAWYEGLLRILGRDGVYESPYHYLPIAQATGEDRDISRFMVSQACYALEITDADISVNISLGDMLKPEFLDHVAASLAASPGRRGTLIFEILESEELIDIDACARFIAAVKDLGCKIAIDDFGSGYSNFTNIARLPIDIVKIDGALIQRMLADTQAYDIVDGIVALCRKLGARVVAEHIDRDELLCMVRRIGVDYGQGFLLGEPMFIPTVSARMLE